MIVTFVHGTWAPDAAWTRVTSNLSLFLQSQFNPLRIEPLRWSGRNSHAARIDGAIKLRAHILDCKKQSPNESQIIIAHSHGGNVVMYALRDSEAAAAVSGVICLSTPYLYCRGRNLGSNGIDSTVKFFFWSIVLTCSIPFWILFPYSSSGAVSMVQVIIIGAAVTGVAAAILAAVSNFLEHTIRSRFRLPKKGKLQKRVFESFSYPTAGSIPTLSIRAPGDEATTALTTVHALSAVFTHLYRLSNLFSAITNWFEKVVSSSGLRLLFSLLFLAPAALFGMLAFETDVELLLIPAMILGLVGLCLVQSRRTANWLVMLSALCFGFVPFLVLAAICVFTSAFGKDTGLIACFFELTCETTPPGNASVHILNHQQKQDLWHSVPYQSPDAFVVMQNWIDSIRGPDAAGFKE